MRKSLIILLVIAIGCKGQSNEVLSSSTGCCSIEINHKDSTVLYKSVLGTDLESYSSLEEMDEIINAMQEHCYHNHEMEY